MSDGQPDPEMEAAGEREVLALLEEIDDFMPRIRALRIRAGGALQRADGKTSYAPISKQVGWQLQIAADHLNAFVRLVREKGELPHYSGYVLVRAALEACASALWLLGPGKPAQRILRSLQLSWWSAEEANDFASDVGFDGETLNAEIRSHLDELRRGVKELRQNRLDVTPISRTNMFLDVQRRFPFPKQLTPLHAWRVCSSLAHGNSAMAVMALKRQQIDPDDPSRHIASSSWALVATFLRVAVWMFNRAVERFEEIAMAP
ncbi:hypothetical protein [Microbacterium oxydans]|uniref:hypothetical protein n=1 Tax=Microbacterium oxydans TaxID=82380 RepID=UPI003670149D